MLVRNTARAGLRADHDRRARHASAPAAGRTRSSKRRCRSTSRSRAPRSCRSAPCALMMHAGEMPQAQLLAESESPVESIKTLGAARLLRPGSLERHRPVAVGPVAGRHDPRRPQPADDARPDRPHDIGDMPDFDPGMKMAAAGFAELHRRGGQAHDHHQRRRSRRRRPAARSARSSDSGVKISTVAVGSHGIAGQPRCCRTSPRRPAANTTK